MKIVLTNDDGYAEPGLKALYEALRHLGEAVIVAPRYPQSGVGHSISLKGKVHVEQDGESRYIVDGTPVDCARLACKVFAPDAEWLISGINPGANLGTDVYPSGTVAAAREAAILGKNAIALSQYIGKDLTIDWKTTALHASRIVSALMETGLCRGRFYNVNLPHPLQENEAPSYRFCELEKQPHDYSYIRNSDAYLYSGSIHERPKYPGTDVDICFQGLISVTCLAL